MNNDSIYQFIQTVNNGTVNKGIIVHCLYKLVNQANKKQQFVRCLQILHFKFDHKFAQFDTCLHAYNTILYNCLHSQFAQFCTILYLLLRLLFILHGTHWFKSRFCTIWHRFVFIVKILIYCYCQFATSKNWGAARARAPAGPARDRRRPAAAAQRPATIGPGAPAPGQPSI